LLEQNAASDRTFAFAFSLTAMRNGAMARVALDAAASTAREREFTLPEFFNVLRDRQPLDLVAAPGLQLKLEWL
jgi:hypothetical protein